MILAHRRTIQFGVFLILILSFAPTLFAQSSEEYKVYNAVISEMFAGDKVSFDTEAAVKILLINESLTQNFDAGSENWDEVKHRLPNLSDETVNDYKSKLKSRHKLKSSFEAKLKYQMLSDKEILGFFDGELGEGWRKFYKAYPDSGGYISFSRVGFNDANTQALVYFQHSCGSLCATGFYILLDKPDKKWEVRSKGMMWIS